MKTLNDVALGDLLPDSISSDQQVQKSAEAIDPELKTVSGFLLLGAVLANVDKLTSTQLDHIAYSFDLTTWRDYWPLSQKRQVAKTVVAQKCRMGTLSRKFPFPEQNHGMNTRKQRHWELRQSP